MMILVSNLPYLLKAALVTIHLSFWIILGSLLIGTVFGMLSLSENRTVRYLVLTYVFIFRGIPLLVQLFFLYFALPAFGIHLSPFVTAVIVMSIYDGAYVTEIIRGALVAISKGQWDAARSLGYTHWKIMFKIILPQGVRYAIPLLVNQATIIIKETSLVSTIMLWELSLAGKEIVQRSFMVFRIFGGVAIIYFILCYSLSLFGQRLEKKYTYAH
ncbi:MAG: amino acid ABC transporter permease [Deltaproteobacteria bacterium]|nr:amino acid ABC transporter permease [Deltaproteobacteria bacterium]